MNFFASGLASALPLTIIFLLLSDSFTFKGRTRRKFPLRLNTPLSEAIYVRVYECTGVSRQYYWLRSAILNERKRV